MTRKVRNTWAPETGAGVSCAPELPVVAMSIVDSLMALWRGSVEAVDHGRLGHAEREPVGDRVLKRDIEVRAEPLLFGGDGFLAVELRLKGELTHQRPVFTPCPPEADVAFGRQPLAEIELADRQEHLLDDAPVDQRHLVLGGALQRRQCGKDLRERRHRGSVAVWCLAKAELAVVRIKGAVAADPVLERQD